MGPTDPAWSQESSSDDDRPIARPANPRGKQRELAKMERSAATVAQDATVLIARLRASTGAERDSTASESWKRLKDMERRHRKTDKDLARSKADLEKLTGDTTVIHQRVKGTVADGENLLTRLKATGSELPQELAEDLMGIVIFAFGSLDTLRDISPQGRMALKNTELDHYRDSNPLPLFEETRARITRLHEEFLQGVPQARKEDQERFEKALAQHEERERRLEKACADLNGKLLMAEKNAAQARDLHSKAAKDMDTLKSRSKAIVARNNETATKYEGLKKSNSELVAKNDACQAQIQALNTALDELGRQRDEAVTSLECRLEQGESERLNLRDRLTEMSNIAAENDMLRPRLDQETIARQQAETLAAGLRLEADGARGAHEAASEELTRERREAGGLRDKLLAMSNEKRRLDASRATDASKMEAFKKRIAALDATVATTRHEAAAALSTAERKRQTETSQLQEKIKRLMMRSSGEERQHRQQIQHQEEQHGKLAQGLQERCELAESQCQALRVQMRDEDAMHAHETSRFQDMEMICDAVEAQRAIEAEQLEGELARERAASEALRAEAEKVLTKLGASEEREAGLREELSRSREETESARRALAEAEDEHDRTRDRLRLGEATRSELESAHGERLGRLYEELTLGGQHMCVLFDLMFGVEPDSAELGKVLHMLTDPAAEGQVSEVTDAFWGVNPPWTSSYGPASALASGLQGRLLQLYSMSLRDPAEQSWLPTVLHIISRIMAAVGGSLTSQAGPLMYFITGKLDVMRPRLAAVDVGPMLLSIALRECLWKVEQRFHNSIGEQRVDFASLACDEPVLRSFNDAIMDGKSRRQLPIEQQLRVSPGLAFHEFTLDDGMRVGALTAVGSKWFMLLDLDHHTVRLVSKRLARVDSGSWPEETPAITSPREPQEDIFIFNGAPHATSIWWRLHLLP